MSPRTEEQFEEIRKEKRELILKAALEEFAEHGYHASSINAVAKKANISKGLIYNYFESKEDLLKNVIINGFDFFVKEFDPNKDGFLTENEFDFFIDRVFELLKENITFWRLYFSVLMKSGVVEIIKEPMMEYLEPFLNTMVDYYERHGKENPMASAIFFGSVLDGVTMNYVMEPNLFPLEDIKKLLKEKLR
jgi:AcrR family transcriptional regulator